MSFSSRSYIRTQCDFRASATVPVLAAILRKQNASFLVSGVASNLPLLGWSKRHTYPAEHGPSLQRGTRKSGIVWVVRAQPHGCLFRRA